jgi:hypothetical protein
MSRQSENLLLRIRAETLRLNLDRAHSNLNDLPSISQQFVKIQSHLATVRTEAADLRKNLAKLREMVSQRDMREEVSLAQDCLDGLTDKLTETSDEVEALINKSFLVKMTPVSKGIWERLDTSADAPRAKVAEVESDLTHPERAWKKLAEAEKDASEGLFKESVELLGGFALRDTRLDKDICELGDGLVQSIRAAGDDLSVIPGGIGSMMMSIERIIRLPFTEWTIWALPITAHEYWRVSARKQFNHHLALSLGQEGPKLVENDINQRCFGDAFATYAMGPAYAFAAITLLLDPMRAEDDLRMLAAVSMLRCMDPTEQDGFSQSYQTVAASLLSEWNAAKHQTGAISVQLDTSVVDRAVPTLFTRLRAFGISNFTVTEWRSVQNWSEKLLDGTSDQIEVSQRHDLRHALNAAWLARVNPARTEDISRRAQDLADRIKAELVKRSSDPTRGSLRGLR